MGKVKSLELPIKPLTQSPRTVYVYLPNDYDENRKEKYDVLYMFDGHNLFSDEVATYGKSWGIKDYLDKTNIPLVVIGVDCNHTGRKRLDEYCPLPVSLDSWIQPITPEGDITANFFVSKLKPYCEKKFNIHSSREHVGIGGSSMGGLMSLYCIAKYNDIYSKAACVSPTMDICLDELLNLISNANISPDTNIYMDFGSKEVKRKERFAFCIDELLQINHAFSLHHASTYPNVVVGGTHSEASWETIVPVFIEYLYNSKY